MSNNPKKKPLLSLVVYVAMAIVVAFLLIDRHPPTLTVGGVAPIDARIALISGTKTTIRRLMAKPMVINFWAGFCPACLKEMPSLSKLFTKYRTKVTFLGLSLGTNIEEIASIKKRFLLDYEFATVTDDVVDAWQARVLPTTYIIDRQGRVIWAKAGMSSEEELERAIAVVLER